MFNSFQATCMVFKKVIKLMIVYQALTREEIMKQKLAR